jgi:hypothetical protein
LLVYAEVSVISTKGEFLLRSLKRFLTFVRSDRIERLNRIDRLNRLLQIEVH